MLEKLINHNQSNSSSKYDSHKHNGRIERDEVRSYKAIKFILEMPYN